MVTFKPVIHDLGNNTFLIRNHYGLVFKLIGSIDIFTGKWKWMQQFVTDMQKNPNYVLDGTLLHPIPDHVKKIYFNLMQKRDI
jgi:hypothetical protein